jgi:hypothetical protein
MKPQMVPDWKDAWKWISMWCMGIALTAQTAWETMPASLKDGLPEATGWYVTTASLVVGMIGRLVQQKPAEKTEAQGELFESDKPE